MIENIDNYSFHNLAYYTVNDWVAIIHEQLKFYNGQHNYGEDVQLIIFSDLHRHVNAKK